jgi:hypothetical protein
MSFGYPALGHQLHLLVSTFKEKSVEKYIANHLVQEIVHIIVWRFVHRIARVDGPLHCCHSWSDDFNRWAPSPLPLYVV